MISYLCNKANKINDRSIKIDIAEFESHERKITEKVKEVGILNIIYLHSKMVVNFKFTT